MNLICQISVSLHFSEVLHRCRYAKELKGWRQITELEPRLKLAVHFGSWESTSCVLVFGWICTGVAGTVPYSCLPDVMGLMALYWYLEIVDSPGEGALNLSRFTQVRRSWDGWGTWWVPDFAGPAATLISRRFVVRSGSEAETGLAPLSPPSRVLVSRVFNPRLPS